MWCLLFGWGLGLVFLIAVLSLGLVLVLFAVGVNSCLGLGCGFDRFGVVLDSLGGVAFGL